MDERQNTIAREAARLFHVGRAANVVDAIRLAADQHDGATRRGPWPSPVRVREHIHFMSLQSDGEQAYRGTVLRMWRTAEELMTLIETFFGERETADTLLVGRAADGHIDGGVTIHVRVYTRASLGELAAAMVDMGYDEPKFQTANTRLGRLDRLRVHDPDHELVVTRCLPDQRRLAGRDLFTGRPISTLTLDQLRTRIDA